MIIKERGVLDSIYFITNSQKREWTSLSSDLSVFLTSVKAIWTTLGMSMVSIVVDKALYCITI